MSSLTKIPAGVQYFFDGEVRSRRLVERLAMEVFAGWSYDEIMLPMFDYHDLFARGMGKERADKSFRFTDRDGELLALRPELTSLVGRTVATRFINRPRPVRLCYSGEVFRYDEPGEKSSREFHQLGIEQIGSAGLSADVEVLLIAVELLGALGIKDFRITLSHVDFFKGLAEALKIDDGSRRKLRDLIDRRNAAALAEFLENNAPQMSAERRDSFCKLTQIGGKKEALERASETLRNETSRVAIGQLASIFELVSQLGFEEYFDIDFGDAAGLEYYSGLTFKVFVAGIGFEIGSGGRYDNLLSSFGAAEPAVGFSFNLDGLVEAATRNGLQPEVELHEELPASNENLADLFRRALAIRERRKRIRIS